MHASLKVIPTHFGPGGQSGGLRAKVYIWTLPVLGIVKFILITAFTGYAGRRVAGQAPPERASRTRSLMVTVKALFMIPNLLASFIVTYDVRRNQPSQQSPDRRCGEITISEKPGIGVTLIKEATRKTAPSESHSSRRLG